MKGHGRTKSVCMPVFSYYPFDPRVRRAAEALVEEGHSVDVICLKDKGEKSTGSFNGVNIHRVSLIHKRGGYLRYVYHYTMFFILVFLTLNRLDLRRKYDVVHVHSLPDFLVFVAIIQKLKKRKIILDLHEVMPEIYAARFKKKMDSSLVKFVCFLERISCSFAHHVITVNDARREVLEGRSVPHKKTSVIMNTPDDRVFVKRNVDDFVRRLHLEDKYITVYVGGINPERNLEVIIKAMALLKKDVPEIFFVMFGHSYGQEGSHYVDDLKTLAEKQGVSDSVFFGGRLAGEEVAGYMDLAHFGVISYIANPMTELAMPNKVFEYISLDVPIISCRLKGLYSLMGDEAAVYFEPENEKELAEKILWLHDNPAEAKSLTLRGRGLYKSYTWAIMKKRLQNLYNRL
jgi:glycosyltransferase involved in cell wall biosynthesis